MAQTKTVLSNDAATHVRVSLGAAAEIARRAKARNVAAWMIVNELLGIQDEK